MSGAGLLAAVKTFTPRRRRRASDKRRLELPQGVPDVVPFEPPPITPPPAFLPPGHAKALRPGSGGPQADFGPQHFSCFPLHQSISSLASRICRTQLLLNGRAPVFVCLSDYRSCTAVRCTDRSRGQGRDVGCGTVLNHRPSPDHRPHHGMNEETVSSVSFFGERNAAPLLNHRWVARRKKP
ncbi:protein phosphatase inhibitor activity protein [Homalodisca vitripennis]|nr:protein phosphatase inhibitor activity protein [Homalodisca vitripennis]